MRETVPSSTPTLYAKVFTIVMERMNTTLTNKNHHMHDDATHLSFDKINKKKFNKITFFYKRIKTNTAQSNQKLVRKSYKLYQIETKT